MTQPSPAPIVLRAATVWGTTVLATRVLRSGQSFRLGDGEDAASKPETCAAADSPIRAVGAGWELDARGATGGEIVLRGRREDPAELARSGAPIPIVAGDFGLIQYGNFSVFFQFTEAPRALPKRRRVSWPLVLSFVFSCLIAGGGLALLWAVTTPEVIPKPLELTSSAELAVQYQLSPAELTPPEPEPSRGGDADAKKDAPARAASDARAPKKAPGKPGTTGRERDERREQPGEPDRGLGGMADVLASDVGDEVKRTLSTISSVADALGGLRSDKVVLGQGQGLGLRGAGPGARGVADGVPFGAGTLDTGFGAGSGRGSGTGAGTGTRGLGNARGQDGAGDGAPGERAVQGKDAPRPGQGLSPDQVRRVVMSRMGAFKACYEIATARDPSLKGGVTVSFSIAPGGSVSSVSIANSSLGNPRVEGCITRQFSRLQFPTADKSTHASFPFVFRPSQR